MSYNKIILYGNICRDIELKDINGVGLAKFAIATNHKTKKGTDTCFLDVEVWGLMAKNVAQYCSKGSPILVEGRLKQETWSAQDGSNRSKHVVVAETVQFMGRKQDNN
jgi:single-strand DNA-binding protein